MDPLKYGCDDDIKVKDEDSVVSEKCWHENHRGDSRKWLLRDGFSKTKDRDLKSTTKATYLYPYEEEREHVGERRTLVMQQLYDEAVAEVIEEQHKPPHVEDYCTEYDGNFGGNIEVTKSENEEELKNQKNADGVKLCIAKYRESEKKHKFEWAMIQVLGWQHCTMTEINDISYVTEVTEIKSEGAKSREAGAGRALNKLKLGLNAGPDQIHLFFLEILYEKYPLYKSPPASFWNFKIEKYQKSNAFFPGLTMSGDLKNPFKRHSGFTKPISEVLDEWSL